MAISQLDDKGALIVFDQQNYNRALSVDYVLPLQDVIDRTAKLADAFRRHGWLVVNVIVPNAYGMKLMDEGTQPGGRVERGYVRPRTAEGIQENVASHLGADWHDIVPELTPQPGDLLVVKPFWDAFIGTTLDYDLRQQGVTQVFVTGAMAAIGVESTARTSNNLGYNTVTVIDAMTDFDKDAYHNSVEKIFPRISERASTAEVLRLLDR
ncbi:MAG TPA: isochorismatase family cysteine hydrolase [Pseudonocardiaceae bacterium]|jgi:nicotinamidase-related amidase|nr:isochorismatase family cysteine hydrolase [Pseudonocardiaceae bacterium]